MVEPIKPLPFIDDEPDRVFDGGFAQWLVVWGETALKPGPAAPRTRWQRIKARLDNWRWLAREWRWEIGYRLRTAARHFRSAVEVLFCG